MFSRISSVDAYPESKGELTVMVFDFVYFEVTVFVFVIVSVIVL